MARHQQETGTVDKRASDVDKWTERLNAKFRELDALPPGNAAAKEPAREKAARAASKSPPANRRPPVSFRSYVPLDFEAEKARVLESYRAPNREGGSVQGG